MQTLLFKSAQERKEREVNRASLRNRRKEGGSIKRRKTGASETHDGPHRRLIEAILTTDEIQSALQFCMSKKNYKNLILDPRNKMEEELRQYKLSQKESDRKAADNRAAKKSETYYKIVQSVTPAQTIGELDEMMEGKTETQQLEILCNQLRYRKYVWNDKKLPSMTSNGKKKKSKT